MRLRRKKASGPRAVIEGVKDPARRSEIAEQASDVASKYAEQASEVASKYAEQATEVASKVAANVAKRSADWGSQAGDRLGDVAHVASEEGRAFMKQHAKNRPAKKPRRHRVRNGAVLAGIGALAAYFLDPENGDQRRAAAKRRTSTSAQAVGDGLDKAAHAAHQTAEATGTHQQGMPVT